MAAFLAPLLGFFGRAAAAGGATGGATAAAGGATASNTFASRVFSSIGNTSQVLKPTATQSAPFDLGQAYQQSKRSKFSFNNSAPQWGLGGNNNFQMASNLAGGGSGGGGTGQNPPPNVPSPSGGGNPGATGGGGVKGMLNGILKEHLTGVAKLGMHVVEFVQNPLAKSTEMIRKFGAAINQLEAPFRAIGEYVGKFNPAQMSFFNRASDDLKASVGENLVPVMQAGTKLVRFFGDGIAGLTPVVRPLVTTITNLTTQALKPWGDAIRGIFQTVYSITGAIDRFVQSAKPMFDVFSSLSGVFASVVEAGSEITSLFVDIFGVIVSEGSALDPVFKTISVVFRSVTNFFKQIAAEVRAFREYLGFKTGNFEGGSQGKAFVGAQTETVTSYISRLQQESFGMGQSTPEKDTAKNTADTTVVLQKILDYFGTDFLSKLGEILRDALPDRAIQRGVGRVQNTVDDALERLGQSIGNRFGSF